MQVLGIAVDCTASFYEADDFEHAYEALDTLLSAWSLVRLNTARCKGQQDVSS